MAEPLISCPVCGHPTRKHNASGCTIGDRFDGCWCSETPEDINPPAPEPVPAGPVEFKLPPAKPGDEDLVQVATVERFGDLVEVEREAPGPRPILDAVPPVDEPMERELVGELRGPDFQAYIAEPAGYDTATEEDRQIQTDPPRRTPGATCECGLADIAANAGLHRRHCSRYSEPRVDGNPPAKRRGRPPRTGAVAYAAPGEVLGAWRSYACRTCGNRRYEAHDCCGGPAMPVTLTMTRGHGG